WEGTNVLWRPLPAASVAAEHGMSADELEQAVERTGVELFERRAGRPQPGLDDKILAAWNGLTIAALAEAGAAFDEPRYADAAALVIRPKELFDNAVPSGNSAAADVLQRLALLSGDAELERLGAEAIRVVRDLLERRPSGFGHALCALDLYTSSPSEIAIVG